nr:carboxylesterase family protein [uncultured Blautia sp.]
MEKHIVETNKGKIRGYLREGMIEYRGIPFAKPPVGKLRFKRAQEMDSWKGIFDAKEYGDEAIQLDGGVYKGSENCLTLVVQRPLEGDKLPVFVWIHGGGYNTGGINVPLFDGKAFVKEGIVFVAFQYRLNVLGFYDFTTYPGCEEFESNCGLSDQIMAMKWIHENIEAFGGDPKRVTIAGESAGGASVINMLAIPAVKGMFQHAIIQSGLPNCVMTHEMAKRNMDLYLEGMGWDENDIPKLLTMDPFEMLKGNEYVAQKHQYHNPGIFLPGPVQDDLMPVRPIDAIRKGSAAGVQIIIGTNKDEGTMFVHPENTGFPNCKEMIQEMFEKNELSGVETSILDYYGSEALGSYIKFATDYVFLMPSLKVAEAQKNYGDVWFYQFELLTKSGEKTGMGVSHAFDLPCVFANKDFEFSRFFFEGEAEAVKDSIIRDMNTAWVNFTKNGNPDSENWPKYSGYNSNIRIFDRETNTEKRDYRKMMELWGDMRFYEGK